MYLLRRRAVKNREVAVIVGWRVGHHARGAGRQDRFLSKQEMIPIDAAGCVGFSAEQSPSGVALTADVISVLANQLVKGKDFKVLARLQSLVRDETERYKSSLWRIASSHGDTLPFQIVDSVNPGAGPHKHNRGQAAIRIAHADRFYAPAEGAGDALAL
jgi:hypothetical protein